MTKGAKNVAESFNKHVKKMYGTICQVVYIVLFSSLSVASLSVGIARKSECPMQTKIPLWLIVYGGVGLALNVIMIIGVRQFIHLDVLEL
jgi:hypothetical protein